MTASLSKKKKGARVFLRSEVRGFEGRNLPEILSLAG
jgi:hypothetical protein